MSDRGMPPWRFRRRTINALCDRAPGPYNLNGTAEGGLQAMDRTFVIAGSIAGALGVAAGAFGAHGLKGTFSPEMLAVFETGVRYHLIHALALLGTAWAATRWETRAIRLAGRLFAAGILIFSGSLYVLCLTGIRWLGAVTPIGGAALIIGWLALAWGAWTGK
jgi:uncharacterized membrane protein YgdD (TMEM256/DUF423 family)